MDFWDDAGWYLQQVDVVYGRARLLRLDEAAYRASIFLDQRIAVRNPQARIVDLWTLADEAAGREAVPADYILHVGHCGSTLATRALQDATTVLPLREPVPLRALATLERSLGDPLAILDRERFDRLSRLLYAAYARTFEENQAALIKGTSSCSNLLGAILAAHPENRVVFLHLPLEAFLATLLRSDSRRDETAQFAPSRLADLHRLTGDDSSRLYAMGPGELTAMSWLANMLWWERNRDSERVLAVDFERLLDRPLEELARIAAFFGLPSEADGLDDAYRRVTAGYSKDPSVKYSRAVRDGELNRARQQWGDEIDRGIRWAEEQAQAHSAVASVLQA